ncbi:MAG TPA: squalene/phytoene synthase family protein [Terrimicrobiaceae bacterium]
MNAPPLELAPRANARKSNLAFALGCLPPDRRSDALVFYDFCRAVDDIADDSGRSNKEKRELLERWKTCLTLGEGLPEALVTILNRHSIDRRLLVEIVLGVETDIEPTRFQTHDDLRAYCWRVASAVGLVSIEIFGCRNPQSKVYAEFLGYALQLTNILRDVAEDAAVGRIYLPLDDLQRFQITEASLLAGNPSDNFGALMSFEAERARSLFADASRALAKDDAKALKPAELMRTIYERILSRMEADGFRVFQKRYRLSKAEKLFALLYSRFCPVSFATSKRVGII